MCFWGGKLLKKNPLCVCVCVCLRERKGYITEVCLSHVLSFFLDQTIEATHKRPKDAGSSGNNMPVRPHNVKGGKGHLKRLKAQGLTCPQRYLM